ncbi:MAG: hypothetical protein NT135_00405 [Candidatus Berkelbacteria bacterium]|nr:hypothetical protein [Candidatus Berkelbacteria bacterium]
MDKCEVCGVPIDDNNRCSCHPNLCAQHCTCDEDCTCGCKQKAETANAEPGAPEEKTEEPAEGKQAPEAPQEKPEEEAPKQE